MGPVKIVATVGPASASRDKLEALAEAGATVFRINCSHSTPEEAARLALMVREAAPEAALLVDLQGPKLRTGTKTLVFNENESLVIGPGDLTFDPYEVGVRAGDRILVADGQIELKTVDTRKGRTEVTVLRGGTAAPARGVNLPDSTVEVDTLTAQDREHIEAANAVRAEWVALSFVRGPQDILRLRGLLRTGTGVVAKIERREALTNLERIVAEADAVMAARGDLGVEIPYEDVPVAQQLIADTALKAGKASICATEMLESMRTGNRPTRAEVSDVAAAVTGGYGAVMLSAETATGEHPVEAVHAMRRICDHRAIRHDAKLFADSNPREAAVSAAASALAMRTGAERILALTLTGYSAKTLSACRPPATITAVTPDPEVARQLNLYWGVVPLVAKRKDTVKGSVTEAEAAARKLGQPLEGTMVVTASRTNPSRPPDTIWLSES